MKKKTNNKLDTFFYFVIFIILILFIINFFVINNRFTKVKDAQEIAKEKMRPAMLEVIKIIPADCDDCYDIDLLLEELKKENVNITDEVTLVKDEAAGLITKYNFEKLPAMLVTGEINKSDKLIKFFNDWGQFIDNGTAVLTKIKPPYYLINKNKVVGMVSVINIVDSSCNKCFSLLPLVDNLKDAGVKVASENTFEYNSTEGLDLISTNEIKAIPAMIISDEIDYYEEIKKALEGIGADKRNNAYAIHASTPPYRNLTDGRIVGLVDLINIVDPSCEVCYDINQNKLIVERLGVVIDNEFSYNVSSKDAENLIAEYNITKVPIILLSPDASIYDRFLQAWNDVGSIEDNGWLVMRKPELLGPYKDLTTGKVVAKQNE